VAAFISRRAGRVGPIFGDGGLHHLPRAASYSTAQHGLSCATRSLGLEFWRLADFHLASGRHVITSVTGVGSTTLAPERGGWVHYGGGTAGGVVGVQAHNHCECNPR
jgi:hypothetical protein